MQHNSIHRNQGIGVLERVLDIILMRKVRYKICTIFQEMACIMTPEGHITGVLSRMFEIIFLVNSPAVEIWLAFARGEI